MSPNSFSTTHIIFHPSQLQYSLLGFPNQLPSADPSSGPGTFIKYNKTSRGISHHCRIGCEYEDKAKESSAITSTRLKVQAAAKKRVKLYE